MAEYSSGSEEENPPKGVIRWLVSCDESGTHGGRFYGFGMLWMPWRRRGDFAELFNRLRAEHSYSNEAKWTSVSARWTDFYEDLVEEFFKTRWLAFHCCLVERAAVRKELHGGDYDLARRKHFAMLLTNKFRRCLHAHPEREHTFRVLVDPLASRYAKADEAAEVICNNALAKVFGRRPVDRVLTRDSKATPSIQLCDVLLGAVIAAWQGDVAAEPKLDAQTWIAHHLGWDDLRADTHPSESKFNIWMFHDPARDTRRAVTRPVSLVYPIRGNAKQ